MNVTCPNCSTVFDAGDVAAGSTVTCTACNASLVVPGAAPAAAPAAAPVAGAAAWPPGLSRPVSGKAVDGLMIAAPAGWRDAILNVVNQWASTTGYRGTALGPGSVQFVKGYGILTGKKYTRISLLADDAQQVLVEYAPWISMMGMARTTIDASFVGAIPAATARRDRDTLAQMLGQLGPGVSIQRVQCLV